MMHNLTHNIVLFVFVIVRGFLFPRQTSSPGYRVGIYRPSEEKVGRFVKVSSSF